MQSNPWTALTACYVKGVLNVRLRFGEPQRIEPMNGGLTRYWFAPGQRFGFLWWARLSPRRQVAGFAVAEALSAKALPAEASDVHFTAYRLPCLDRPMQVHAFLHCRCVGRDRGVVGRADELIRFIQQSDIDPCRVPPMYYRLAGQALRVGHAPRPIDPEQLRCFLEEQVHAS